MKTTKIQKEIRDFFLSILRFLWELVLFVWNLPRYLCQFLRGLRLFSESYSGILRALEEQELWGERLKTTKFEDSQAFTEEMRDWINDTIRLSNEHEKMFAQFFGILIAVLALLASVLALLAGRK